MTKIYPLISIKNCQFLIYILLFLFLNTAKSIDINNKKFICEYKNTVDYINSLILLDHNNALLYIEDLKKNDLPLKEVKKLITILMRYRLLPIGNKKKCRFFNYMCIGNDKSQTMETLANTYLKQNPNGLTVCHFLLNGKEIKKNIFSKECNMKIKKRIQPIPLPLSIAQATLESRWGTSNFAKNGNNFFGIQTLYSSYQKVKNNPKCLPSKKICIYKFNSQETNFFIYSQLLNSHYAYQEIRNLRYQSKLNQESICETSHKMALGLKSYSINPNYINKVKELISLMCVIIDHC